jgi:hypothetical protein
LHIAVSVGDESVIIIRALRVNQIFVSLRRATKLTEYAPDVNLFEFFKVRHKNSFLLTVGTSNDVRSS